MRAEGKGVNVARQFTLLGHDVALICFTGGQTGRWLSEIITSTSQALRLTMFHVRAEFAWGGKKQATDPGLIMERGFHHGPRQRKLCGCGAKSIRANQADLCIISGPVPNTKASKDLWVDIAEACQNDTRSAMDRFLRTCHATSPRSGCVDLAKPNKQEFDSLHNWQNVQELHVSDGKEPLSIRSHDQYFS